MDERFALASIGFVIALIPATFGLSEYNFELRMQDTGGNSNHYYSLEENNCVSDFDEGLYSEECVTTPEEEEPNRMIEETIQEVECVTTPEEEKHITIIAEDVDEIEYDSELEIESEEKSSAVLTVQEIDLNTKNIALDRTLSSNNAAMIFETRLKEDVKTSVNNTLVI